MEQPKVVNNPVSVNPENYQEWEKAELSGLNTETTEMPASSVQPQSAEEPKSDISSEPAKPKKDGEVKPQLEPGASQQEPPPEPKASPKDEEHSPGWYRRELKRIRRELREENDGLRTQLTEITQRVATPLATPIVDAAPATAAGAEPVEGDFDSYDAFDKAHLKWVIRQEAESIASGKIADFQKSVQRQLREQEENDARQLERTQLVEQDRSFAEQVERGREKHEDFDEVVFAPDLKVTPLMDQFVHNSPVGDEVSYHLASNREEIQRIAQLPYFEQVSELLGIQTKFLKPGNGKASATDQTLETSSSLRPAPPSQIGGGNNMAAIQSPDDPNVAKDYKLWERLELQRRKK